MGKWHTWTQIGITLKKIQNDVSIQELYDFELSMGWTEANNIRHFWKNTKERILKLTGNSVLKYIPRNTINYKKVVYSMLKLKKLWKFLIRKI